jgi:Predicted membrane protein (DUF2231)
MRAARRLACGRRGRSRVFLTVPIRIKTIYGGLPAHPLFIHVPVTLIPISVLGAIACVARPAWLDRYGILLSVTAIVALFSTFLAMQAGAALRGALNLRGAGREPDPAPLAGGAVRPESSG